MRAPDYFIVKPPSQTGFPNEVSGQGSFVLTLALPSGQPCCSSATVNRQLEGIREHSFLLFLMPLTSLSSLVVDGVYGYTGWTSKSFLLSLFTSRIFFRRGPSFWPPTSQLYLPKGVASSLYTVKLNGKKVIQTVRSSHSLTVIKHKRHEFQIFTFHSSHVLLFQEYIAISMAHLIKFLLKIQLTISKIQLRINFMILFYSSAVQSNTEFF